MALFEPWIGNMNPTDQAKNEYIRKLKEALVNISTITVAESGQYTGDGTASRTIILNNQLLRPKFIAIYKNSVTAFVAFTFDEMEQGNGTTFIAPAGAAGPVSATGRISTFLAGSFVVDGTTATGMNINTHLYYWFVLGTQE